MLSESLLSLLTSFSNSLLLQHIYTPPHHTHTHTHNLYRYYSSLFLPLLSFFLLPLSLSASPPLYPLLCHSFVFSLAVLHPTYHTHIFSLPLILIFCNAMNWSSAKILLHEKYPLYGNWLERLLQPIISLVPRPHLKIGKGPGVTCKLSHMC